ncbi:MAG: ATP-binding protein [Bacteroidales bacterium 52_46]|nr:MAG: ATP-binding protein [Bacteroidales bacterium 52_46]
MVNPEILREVMLENREEVMRREVIKRSISLDGFERQVLVGARRAGKSYLMYGKIQELLAQGHSWDEIVYLNFEDERLAGMELNDLNKIFEVHAGLGGERPMLFLDEIQNIDGWEHFARRVADSKLTVFITGSNAKMLSVDVSAALGGRYMTREVFPMQFDEYLMSNGVNSGDELLTATTVSRGRLMKLFEEYFQFGGFPECSTLPVKRDYIMSLYQKIFLGDIAARHRIENIFALRTLLRKLAESVNQPISFTRATNIVASTGTKIGKSTVINYLGYAADAYLVLPMTNIADCLTERVSNPKYYFIDNGIISLLTIDNRTSLLENIVALKLLANYGTKQAVYFYNHGIEIDFYIPHIETAIQVSYSINDAEGTFEREVNALVKVQSRLSCRNNIIVTYGEESIIEKGGVRIEVIPVWKFLLNFDK